MNARPRVIIAKIPVLMESCLVVQVTVDRRMTAKTLCEHLGIYPPSILYKWPARMPFKPNENLFEAIENGICPYVRSIDPQSLQELHQRLRPQRQ